MTSDARLIDRLRAGLYALPLPVFAMLSFVGFWLMALVVAMALAEWDPSMHLSLRGKVVYAVVFGAVMTVGSAVGEHNRRKKFVNAQDRAAYHRAVDREVLPDAGAPVHWREQMLNELTERSRALFGAIAFAVAFGFVVAVMIARGGEWPLVVAAVALYVALAAGLLVQWQRSKKAERLYAASSPRSVEAAR